MFDFRFDSSDRVALYDDLLSAARGVTAGETDPVANMANLSGLIWQALPDLNWAGFYRADGGELVLGPFQGKPACIRIGWGSGVCGTAAATRTTQRVDDVHAFQGHIACDAVSRSEIVVPIIVAGTVIAVLDLDSSRPARFTAEDQRGLEALAAAIAHSITPSSSGSLRHSETSETRVRA